jgi:transaldolase
MATGGDLRKAVFLDRDGVLVVPSFRDGRSFAPLDLAEYRFYPEAAECLRRLKQAGFALVVVTNQPDVGAGKIARDVVEEMHRRLAETLPVDAIEACFHTERDRCACRKPRPGMLFTAARELGIDLAASFMVGDRRSDIEAGAAAGCRTIFIDLGYTTEKPPDRPNLVVKSLAEATNWILSRIEGACLMTRVDELKVKLFADGADLAGMVAMRANPMIRGFTTNPTLMRKAGITDYETFARQVLAAIPDRPVSFEVFADDFDSMEQQGRVIAGWGRNVYVKIPVVTTSGEFTGPVIRRMSRDGILLNITAVMTVEQVIEVAEALDPNSPAIVSVFAGRVADTGIDPMPHMRACLKAVAKRPKAELLWASPRELLNIFQADEVGCHIITATNDVLAKLQLVGKDLTEYSRETVQMFYRDANACGFAICTKAAA